MSAFADILPLLRGALVLDDATFESLRDDPGGLLRGLRFLISIALAVGLVLALYGFFSGMLSSPSEQMGQAATEIDQTFEMIESFGGFSGDPEAEAIMEMILDNVKAGLSMGAGIAQVAEETTPAPRVFVVFFESLAKMLSLPFAWLGLWLLWGVLTLLFARLYGGTATIQQMLAVSALVAAPHVLDAFGFIPCLGGLLGLIATLWAIVVYVKATAVANRMGYGMATLAVFTPILIPIVLSACGLLAILVASGGNG